MSSISIRKPEFRLLLGYPDVILTREGEDEPVGTPRPGRSASAPTSAASPARSSAPEGG